MFNVHDVQKLILFPATEVISMLTDVFKSV